MNFETFSGNGTQAFPKGMKIKDWQIKGIYNESCASQGHCPYYFGRPRDGGCRYFMVFRSRREKLMMLTCPASLQSIRVIYLTLLFRKCWSGDRTAASTLAITPRPRNAKFLTYSLSTASVRRVGKKFRYKMCRY